MAYKSVYLSSKRCFSIPILHKYFMEFGSTDAKKNLCKLKTSKVDTYIDLKFFTHTLKTDISDLCKKLKIKKKFFFISKIF